MRTLEPGGKLVVASHNKGKVWEINQLLAPYGLNAVSAAELGLDEPEETADTFAGNASLKALAAAGGANLPALADDSGLEIDILDGAPGIYSARWAGPGKDFSVAMRKVADAIAARDGWPKAAAEKSAASEKLSSATPPRANFISVLCLAWPDGSCEIFEGKVFGHLVWPPRGGNGFGYDPMFVPEGDTRTFGEMPPDAKYAISHRTRAFDLFKRECLSHIPPKPVTGGHRGRDLAALSAAAASLSTHVELAEFIARLKRDLEENPHDWSNPTLPDFLAALENILGEPQPLDEPKWRAMAHLLLAASTYTRS